MEPKLSVAVFSDSAFPLVNGVSKSVEVLVGSLRESGHFADLYSPAEARSIRAPRAGVPVALPMTCSPSGKYDLVHLHTPFGMGWTGLTYARRKGIPVIATYHTPYGKVAPHGALLGSRAAKAVLEQLAAAFYRRADRVIVPSPAALEFLRQSGVEVPALVVPTGLPIGPRREKAQHRPSTLICVGRLAKEKRFDLALRAHALISFENPGTRLLMVGDGPLRPDLERLASRLGTQALVTFRGHVPPNALASEWQQGDVLLHPGIDENQGLVVLEALSHGIPAVVSLGGGPAATVQSGTSGYVTAPEPAAIASAVSECLKNWPEMSLGARSVAAAHDPGTMASRILSLYFEAIALAKTSHPRGHVHKRTAYADEP